MTKLTKTTKTILDSTLIKDLAYKIGFDKCGICSTEISDQDIKRYTKWINDGFFAKMNYLTKYLDIRKNPKLLVENAKSIISLCLNYKPNNSNTNYYIAKFARGLDYHFIMKSKLRLLELKLKEHYPKTNTRVFTDSAPILERTFARNCGLGFIGKNTCLINPNLGSYFFIGEIVCDYSCDYDQPIIADCGNCSLCISACPVGALSINGLDANKCISYHTIENHDDIPPIVSNHITNQIFGCDICQDVCPYNKNTPITKHPEFRALNKITEIDLKSLENMSNSQFKKKYSDTSLLRAGRKKLIKNINSL